MNAFMGLLMCSLRDLDCSAAAAAAAAMMESWKETEVTDAGVLGAGVLGEELQTLTLLAQSSSRTNGDCGEPVAEI